MRALLELLPAREWWAVELRFGLDGRTSGRLRRAGKAVGGVGSERVRQVVEPMLGRLRERVGV